ncbi:MAG: ParB/RepB/Spo0J family partition protein [Spirochaetaceae bacterium]|nr:MAG: ParB/RepB/Spo0J family partition protein [Spirochaetaceae bacterium]
MAKRGLGRGMDALMGAVTDEPAGGSGVLTVALSEVVANPDQPRTHFDEAALQELADSIREKGVIQPLLVEQRIDGTYEIIAGERRFRASKMAGVETVPVIVREFTKEEKMEIALIENIQREDLSPVEEARAYKGLLESSGLSQEELAGRLGKNRSTIANALRLLRLPAEVLAALDSGQVSAGHARAILQAGSDEAMAALFERIMAEGLSVRQAETLARGGSLDAAPAPASGAEPAASGVNGGAGSTAGAVDKSRAGEVRKTIALLNLEERLIVQLGTKVQINGSEEKGRLEISYFSLEDLNRLVDLILPDNP